MFATGTAARTARSVTLIELQERGFASSPAPPKRQQPARAPRKEIPSPSSLESSYIVSHTMDRMFLDQNVTQLPTSQPFRQMSPYQDHSGIDPVVYPMLCSTSSTTLVQDISSYTFPPLHQPPSFSAEISGLVSGTRTTYYADYNTGLFDISHAAICGDGESAQDPYVDVRWGN